MSPIPNQSSRGSLEDYKKTQNNLALAFKPFLSIGYKLLNNFVNKRKLRFQHNISKCSIWLKPGQRPLD